MTFPNIAKLIENTVIQCREVGAEAPYYEYGHPLEIVNTLMEKDKNGDWKLRKFPAIFLILKPETEEKRTKFESETELDIIIVTDTKPTWKAADRDVNVFDPVLIPLYERFIIELGRTVGLRFEGEHTFKKHYFWGSENTGANVANDFADAIEIKGLKVTTYASC